MRHLKIAAEVCCGSSTLTQAPLLVEHVIANHLRCCTRFGELECVHAYMVKTCADKDSFFINQFVTACFASENGSYANAVYAQIDFSNVFVYNAMIKGLAGLKDPIRSVLVFTRMLRDGIAPTSYTFSSLIRACSVASDQRLGTSVHSHVWKNGFQSFLFVQTAFLVFYSTMDMKSEFMTMFDEMDTKDDFAWNTAVSCLVRLGDLSSARKIFEVMPERGIAGWNGLLDGYARMGDLETVKSLFKQMPTRDIISWTIMITCLCRDKKFEEAIQAFYEMREVGLQPDEVTLSAIISACAHLGALDVGRELHHYVMINQIRFDVYIGSALVDMYSKCGRLDMALSLFGKLKEKNLYCWNAVIEGLAAHGYAKQALEMFSEMERMKVLPNGVTFVSVLSACTHGGLVEDGRKRFFSMMHDYCIQPEASHYGCMVDLLSKSGLLTEALELIGSMSIEPNAVIWGALLGGCRIHKNLEIAKVAVNELSILEPMKSGHYNVLLNLYAAADKWDEVPKIRMKMRELGIEKSCPGMSWIDVNSKVHRFSSSEKFHQASDLICSVLDRMSGHMQGLKSLDELWHFS